MARVGASFSAQVQPRRSIPARAQDAVYVRPATSRQPKVTQVPGSPAPGSPLAGRKETLPRPTSERTLSPGAPQVFRGYTRPEGRPTSPDRVIGLSLSGGMSPHGSPTMSPQVPVHFAMVSPPRAPVRRYVPQDFGEQIAPWIGKSQSQVQLREDSSEQTWEREDPFYRLRQEIQAQCQKQTEQIRAEVSGLCHETGRKVEEALARLQLREEETAQVHQLLRDLDTRLRMCQAKLEAPEACRELADRAGDLERLQERLDQGLQSMRELLEETRSRQLEERALRCEEVKEMKASLETLRQAPAREEGSLWGSWLGTSRPREEEPGEEMYTVYEMAREALGDTVHLRQLVSEERAERLKELGSTRQQMDVLSRELNTLQAVLREATASARPS